MLRSSIQRGQPKCLTKRDFSRNGLHTKPLYLLKMSFVLRCLFVCLLLHLPWTWSQPGDPSLNFALCSQQVMLLSTCVPGIIGFAGNEEGKQGFSVAGCVCVQKEPVFVLWCHGLERQWPLWKKRKTLLGTNIASNTPPALQWFVSFAGKPEKAKSKLPEKIGRRAWSLPRLRVVQRGDWRDKHLSCGCHLWSTWFFLSEVFVVTYLSFYIFFIAMYSCWFFFFFFFFKSRVFLWGCHSGKVW